jgi:hypothetical protein
MNPDSPRDSIPAVQQRRRNMKNPNCSVAGASFVAVLLLVAAEARAQDVAKVSPETHRLLLENEHVRVFDVKGGEK